MPPEKPSNTIVKCQTCIFTEYLSYSGLTDASELPFFAGSFFPCHECEIPRSASCINSSIVASTSGHAELHLPRVLAPKNIQVAETAAAPPFFAPKTEIDSTPSVASPKTDQKVKHSYSRTEGLEKHDSVKTHDSGSEHLNFAQLRQISQKRSMSCWGELLLPYTPREEKKGTCHANPPRVREGTFTGKPLEDHGAWEPGRFTFSLSLSILD